MKSKMLVDRQLYDSCGTYVELLLRPVLEKPSKSSCDGDANIQELCNICKFYKAKPSNTSKILI